jgi:hypothetical protein
MAGTLIVEKRSLVDCGSTVMPSHQGKAISENSAVVGTNDGPNSLFDGENQIYYDEIINILAKFIGQQNRRKPEDFCRYMRFVCKFVKVQFQKRMSDYKRMWEIVKNVMNVEDFNKEYGISGDPNNHFLQELFDEFSSDKHYAFTSLHLAYEKQNAGTSAQEEEHGKGFLDSDGVRFFPLHKMRGLASNGMPSKQQYCEMAAKFTGQHADRDSICTSASGDTAVIQMNAAADVIMVRCWPEDGKVSGIAAVLRTAAE